MANTKIRVDSHGQYVRTNGSVYRPEESKGAFIGGKLTEEASLMVKP